MTMPASASPFGDRLPDDSERAAADQLRRIIAARASEDQPVALDVIDESGDRQPVILSPAMSDLLMSLLRHLSSGNAVTLVPVGEMLTTQQAADILNVSRPYLIKLIDNREIGCSKVGRHRRLKAEDVFAYKRRMQAARDKALVDIAEADGDFI